jgi:hypothetical protein
MQAAQMVTIERFLQESTVFIIWNHAKMIQVLDAALDYR